MCLVQADGGGFEVFSRTEDARLEVRFFEDEEAAYFYLFGMLAAEAIRSGRLAPRGPEVHGVRAGQRAQQRVGPGQDRIGLTRKRFELLTGLKVPKSAPRPASVYLVGGADGPPLPKQPRLLSRYASS